MKKISCFAAYLLILVVAVKAVYNYGLSPLGASVPDPMALNFQAHPFGIYTHVFAALTALLLGPVQFSSRLRQRYQELHRWLGRVYLGIGVLIGGLSGLYMSIFAYGGPLARLGLISLALIWLFTGARAYEAIRAGAVDEHRAYMVRNFSLTLAAVNLRFYLPLQGMLGIDFDTAYVASIWLSWLPNLLLAEIIWNRRGLRSAPILYFFRK